MNHFIYIFTSLIFIIIFLCFIGTISIYYSHENIFNNFDSNINYHFSNSEFTWPTPGYHTISSYFGKRISPTTGASSNHSGIDIPAAEGTSIFSILSGTVTFTGFYGANGHTIIIKNNNMSFQYSHLSSNYILRVRRYC